MDNIKYKLIFKTEQEAEMILNDINEIINKYGYISVLDCYDLAGEIGSYSDNKIGWESIDGSRIVKEENEFVLELPRVIELN